MTHRGASPAKDRFWETVLAKATKSGVRVNALAKELGLESSEGGAPEVTVHKEQGLASSADLSPEEQAVQVASTEPTKGERVTQGEDDDAAALAEGRVEPPVVGREEPA